MFFPVVVKLQSELGRPEQTIGPGISNEENRQHFVTL